LHFVLSHHGWPLSLQQQRGMAQCPLPRPAPLAYLAPCGSAMMLTMAEWRIQAEDATLTGRPVRPCLRRGGLACRETGDFPDFPKSFWVPSSTRKFISLIISRHSRQTGSVRLRPGLRLGPAGGAHSAPLDRLARLGERLVVGRRGKGRDKHWTFFSTCSFRKLAKSRFMTEVMSWLLWQLRNAATAVLHDFLLSCSEMC